MKGGFDVVERAEQRKSIESVLFQEKTAGSSVDYCGQVSFAPRSDGWSISGLNRDFTWLYNLLHVSKASIIQ